MPDTPATDGQTTDAQARHDQARLALDRAHVAARDADGAGLRRALEEAADLLRDARPEAGARLAQALRDLDEGALAEMESLIEAVRRELSPG